MNGAHTRADIEALRKRLDSAELVNALLIECLTNIWPDWASPFCIKLAAKESARTWEPAPEEPKA